MRASQLTVAAAAAAQGDYTTFMRTMTERIRNARKAAEAQEVKRKHVQAFIDRFRCGLWLQGSGAKALGLRLQAAGCRVQGAWLRCRVQDAEFRAHGSGAGCRMQGSGAGFRAHGSGEGAEYIVWWGAGFRLRIAELSAGHVWHGKVGRWTLGTT